MNATIERILVLAAPMDRSRYARYLAGLDAVDLRAKLEALEMDRHRSHSERGMEQLRRRPAPEKTPDALRAEALAQQEIISI